MTKKNKVKKKAKKRTIVRSAKSGKFVKKGKAKSSPATTVTETVKTC